MWHMITHPSRKKLIRHTLNFWEDFFTLQVNSSIITFYDFDQPCPPSWKKSLQFYFLETRVLRKSLDIYSYRLGLDFLAFSLRYRLYFYFLGDSMPLAVGGISLFGSAFQQWSLYYLIFCPISMLFFFTVWMSFSMAAIRFYSSDRFTSNCFIYKLGFHSQAYFIWLSFQFSYSNTPFYSFSLINSLLFSFYCQRSPLTRSDISSLTSLPISFDWTSFRMFSYSISLSMAYLASIRFMIFLGTTQYPYLFKFSPLKSNSNNSSWHFSCSQRVLCMFSFMSQLLLIMRQTSIFYLASKDARCYLFELYTSLSSCIFLLSPSLLLHCSSCSMICCSRQYRLDSILSLSSQMSQLLFSILLLYASIFQLYYRVSLRKLSYASSDCSRSISISALIILYLLSCYSSFFNYSYST